MTLLDLNKNFINGKWVEGKSERIYDIINPFDNSVVNSIRLATLDQVKESFEIAKKAQKGWAKSTAAERKAILNKAAEFIKVNRTEIEDILCKENGSIAPKVHFESHLSPEFLEEAANFADALDEVKEVNSGLQGKVDYVHRSPAGVVSSISPFNSPLILSIRTIASAIALGNSVVHKPDIQVALSGGSIIARAFEYAGLPAGVLNVVLTQSKEIGDEMLTNPHLNVIGFTGSTEVGRHIGGIAGKNLKRVALELGGNCPFIVLSDADVDPAVDAGIFGKFMYQGQICMGINRFIIHKDKYEVFVQKFVDKAKSLPYGDPKDPTTVIGPMINAQQLDKALKIIDDAVGENIKVELEGKRIGNILTPYVFRDVDNSSKLAQTEVFAPIATMIKANSDEEAIQIANDTEYGLSSAIFTKDIEKARQFALQIDSGMTHINDQTINDSATVPFGGNKASGIGRFGFPWIVEELTVPKWISVQKGYRKFPF